MGADLPAVMDQVGPDRPAVVGALSPAMRHRWSRIPRPGGWKEKKGPTGSISRWLSRGTVVVDPRSAVGSGQQ